MLPLEIENCCRVDRLNPHPQRDVGSDLAGLYAQGPVGREVCRTWRHWPDADRRKQRRLHPQQSLEANRHGPQRVADNPLQKTIHNNSATLEVPPLLGCSGVVWIKTRFLRVVNVRWIYERRTSYRRCRPDIRTLALTILTRSQQVGLNLRIEGEHLKAKDNREVIEAWQSMIQRHRLEVIAALTGEVSDADFVDTLGADSEELTASIKEICPLAGNSDDARNRMLSARRNHYPFQIATESAYFRLQVIRARAGAYWDMCRVMSQVGSMQGAG